jgi:hypothetical protein
MFFRRPQKLRVKKLQNIILCIKILGTFNLKQRKFIFEMSTNYRVELGGKWNTGSKSKIMLGVERKLVCIWDLSRSPNIFISVQTKVVHCRCTRIKWTKTLFPLMCYVKKYVTRTRDINSLETINFKQDKASPQFYYLNIFPQYSFI